MLWFICLGLVIGFAPAAVFLALIYVIEELRGR